MVKKQKNGLDGLEGHIIMQPPYLCVECDERAVQVVQLFTGTFVLTCDECGWEKEISFSTLGDDEQHDSANVFSEPKGKNSELVIESARQTIDAFRRIDASKAPPKPKPRLATEDPDHVRKVTKQQIDAFRNQK
jgi:hypothetical protein